MTEKDRMERAFGGDHYAAHNRARLDHLVSLKLPIAGKSVLEVGAGRGDHTGFFLERGCAVTVTDGRGECVAAIQRRYPDLKAFVWDLDAGPNVHVTPHDIVYAYGLLYHLSDPAAALAVMSGYCRELLLLETMVSFGDGLEINPAEENPINPSQALHGQGCRPTRPWVMAALRRHFPHVYTTVTQPANDEFPRDWSRPVEGFARAVFVAARAPLDTPLLTESLPARQKAFRGTG